MGVCPLTGIVITILDTRLTLTVEGPLRVAWFLDGAEVGGASLLGAWPIATCSHWIAFSSCVTPTWGRAGSCVNTATVTPVGLGYPCTLAPSATPVARSWKHSIIFFTSPDGRASNFHSLNTCSSITAYEVPPLDSYIIGYSLVFFISPQMLLFFLYTCGYYSAQPQGRSCGG